MTAPRRGPWLRRLLVAGISLAGLAGLLCMPVTTKQGVNFTVSVHPLPLYLKTLSFLDRHYQYRHLARAITRGLHSDRTKVFALYDWTRAHIHPQPPELPVVDDHIWHIIIRGYGEDDQIADVFTTLATYAGLPAFWTQVEVPRGGDGVIISFVRVEGHWAVFDVAHNLVFTKPDGTLADVQELLVTPELVRRTVGSLAPYSIPYAQFLAGLEPFEVPNVLRARKQMPWPRLWYALRYATARSDTSSGDLLDRRVSTMPITARSLR